MTATPGSAGYVEAARRLIEFDIPSETVHAHVLHLLPRTPSRLLDLGAGAGQDAAWFAEQGHEVVAVEPTEVLRQAAMNLNRSPRITWVDDCLPDLKALGADAFDLVMATAVWMHQDEAERRRAMVRVSGLLKPGARLIMSLRHGVVPAGRRMFEVTAEETIALAGAQGLTVELNTEAESVQEDNRRAGVTWTVLALRKRGAAPVD
jgi:SAM-dependent methyltransferase